MTSDPRSPLRPRAPRARSAVALVAASTALAAALSTPTQGGAQPVVDPDVVAAILADPGSAQRPDPPALDEGGALAGAQELVPEDVREVPVVSVAVRRSEDELAALEHTIRSNRAIRDQAVAAIARLEGERQALRAHYSAARQRRRSASARAEELRTELAQLAVASYVGVGDPAATLGVDAGDATDSGRHRVMVEAVDATLRERLAVAEALRDQAGADADAARGDLTVVRTELDVARMRRDAAIAELARAEPELPLAQERYRDHVMVAQVAGSDLTVVALHAYRSAAREIAAERPGCRLPWTILAGIGRIESRHGTYGRSTLRADGRTSRRIIGIALDGSPGIIELRDTDGGALDGDAVFDRAVGPMQFIPSTWRMIARDGNGDGVRDPHNIYDAASGAAAYLCRDGARFDRPTSRNQAILSYNRSLSYVNAVVAHHGEYQRLRLP